MQFKVIKFKQATNSNDDYQLNDKELEFEIKSKERKWKSLEEELNILMDN